MPESFYEYLRHALQERDQRRLWEQLNVDTSFVPGTPWPERFYEDVKNGFTAAMHDYDRSLGVLSRA